MTRWLFCPLPRVLRKATDHNIQLTVELQQQQPLRAQLNTLDPFPSMLPTSSPFISVTATFQSLSVEASGSSEPEYWTSVSSQPPNHVGYPSTGADQDGFSSWDHYTESEHSCGMLGRYRQGPLCKMLLSFHRTARSLVQWWRQILSPSNLPMSEDSLRQDLQGESDYDGEPSWQYARPDTRITPDALQQNGDVLSQIPEYVMDYAPLVHLYSGEEYWPCHIEEHLHHITPELNFTPVQAGWQHPGLNNLSALNRWEYGRHVFLTSDDNVEEHPEWLRGEKNIPAAPPPPSQGFKEASEKPKGARSDAPAILIVVNKGHGIVDAFWFFFYSFNLGNVVFLRFGNHVGDWEHSVVRFHNGKPKAIFVSEHFFGQAYSYRAVEKSGKRPVIYSATGTHAMYATAGTQAYILPWGLLHDRTDKGPLWDPAQNSYMYTYDLHNDILRPSNFTPNAPTDWFHFAGHWGDKQYPLTDTRQYAFAGNYHYVSGPLGPKFKNLGRRKICQGRESERCVIRNWLGGTKVRRIYKTFDDDEMAEAARERYSMVNDKN